MSTLTVFTPPPAWSNQSIRLYHGTIQPHAAAITSTGVRVSAGNTGTDFGPGFYTTTLERQARSWAWDLHVRKGPRAAVVYADLSREDLAQMDCLVFVRGDFDAEDFWSLVVHCRRGAADHARVAVPEMYDVVVGPVAAFWQRLVISGADQMSFHTAAAEKVLNGSSWRTLP